MLRTILAVVAGFFAWFAIVLGGGFLMRSSWPTYVAVEESMSFTLTMLFARLAIGIVASIVAGRIVAAIAIKSDVAAIALGVVLVLFFIPVHIGLWDKFPLWYHLFFLVTLIPLSIVGGRIARGSQSEP